MNMPSFIPEASLYKTIIIGLQQAGLAESLSLCATGSFRNLAEMTSPALPVAKIQF